MKTSVFSYICINLYLDFRFRTEQICSLAKTLRYNGFPESLLYHIREISGLTISERLYPLKPKNPI
jgi:hypothetical protein